MPYHKLQRHLNYLEQDKKNVNLLITISDCYWQMGDFIAAKLYINQAKQYCANPFELSHMEARLMHQDQKIEEAIALLEQATLQDNENADALGLLALLYFDNNDETRAHEMTIKTLSLEPNHPNGLLVCLLLKSLHNEVTPAEINVLLKLHPKESRLWFVLGTTELHLMNCLDAEHALTQTTQINPQFYEGWICLGWCHQLQNQLDAAETAYRYAIALDSERADGFGGLAVVNALRNQISDAMHWLSQAKQREPESFFEKLAQMLLTPTLNREDVSAQFNSIFLNRNKMQ